MKDDPLFHPIDVGGVTLPNRTVMTTHGWRLPADRYNRYLEERSRGGVGLILFTFLGSVGRRSTYPKAVAASIGSRRDDEDGIQPSDPLDPWYDTLIPLMRERAEIVRRGGAVAMGQLYHPGSNRHAENYQPAVSASEVRGEYPPQVPHELDQAEIRDLVVAYGQDARRAREAGLSGIEIHAAHGYLIAQFLSPRHNLRTDGYGGTLERRTRFLMEILEEIGTQAGHDFPVGVRLSATEEAPQIGLLVERQVAYLSLSLGSYDGMFAGEPLLPYVAPWLVGDPPALPIAAAVKRAVSVPVCVAGRITGPEMARRVLNEGIADMVGFARALIADPRMVEKMRTGRDEEVNLCIGCNECHRGITPTCTVNPMAGREAELEVKRASRRRGVLVVGGGPAGMQAAVIAAQRGHAVTLVERQSELGGALRLFCQDPGRAAWSPLIAHLNRELVRTGVEVRLGTQAGPADVADADALIVATGGEEMAGEGGVTSAQVLRGEVGPVGDVVVASAHDDGLDGPMISLMLAARGCTVTLCTEALAVGEGLELGVRHVVTRRLLEARVRVMPLTRVEVDRLSNVMTGVEEPHSGNVVWAAGRRAGTSLLRDLKAAGVEGLAIGDALAPRRLVHAMLDAARVAVAI